MTELDLIAEFVARRLIERKESVAVAESAAGGRISVALLGVAGASAYYKGGAVLYTGEGIKQLVRLTDAELEQHRSATVGRSAMLARAIREHLGATWGIAETGAAGPTGNRYGDAAGHAALATSGPIDRTLVLETGNNDRRQNMEAFAKAALELLLAAMT
jgi:nicotinamide-nucleotide amidase